MSFFKKFACGCIGFKLNISDYYADNPDDYFFPDGYREYIVVKECDQGCGPGFHESTQRFLQPGLPMVGWKFVDLGEHGKTFEDIPPGEDAKYLREIGHLVFIGNLVELLFINANPQYRKINKIEKQIEELHRILIAQHRIGNL